MRGDESITEALGESPCSLSLRFVVADLPAHSGGRRHRELRAHADSEIVAPLTVSEHGDNLNWPDHCVGLLDYALVAGVLYVNVIETHPGFQRRGVATALLAEARRRYPGRRPVHEGLSRSGLAWWETFGDPHGDWLEDHV